MKDELLKKAIEMAEGDTECPPFKYGEGCPGDLKACTECWLDYLEKNTGAKEIK